MIQIDGKMGEGGGQVLRTSLALSLVTGQPFTIENIRGGRRKPGLLRQHYTAVKAAAEVGQAKTSGFGVGATRLRFEPTTIRSGDFSFAVGSAGSGTLVVQTILPALLHADGPSTVRVEGGTHNPMAPPVEFLQASFLPCLERMGANVSMELHRHGFYPAGGGSLTATVQPCPPWKPLEAIAWHEDPAVRASATVSNLGKGVANREARVLEKKLDLAPGAVAVVEVVDPIGPGNVVQVALTGNGITEVVSAFGERGVTAERVAQFAVRDVRRYLKAQAPVGEHLADQLILPLALGAGGRFRTLPPSKHLTTVVDVVRKFLDVDILLRPTDDIAWEVEVMPRQGGKGYER